MRKGVGVGGGAGAGGNVGGEEGVWGERFCLAAMISHLPDPPLCLPHGLTLSPYGEWNSCSSILVARISQLPLVCSLATASAAAAVVVFGVVVLNHRRGSSTM